MDISNNLSNEWCLDTPLSVDHLIYLSLYHIQPKLVWPRENATIFCETGKKIVRLDW